MHERLINIYKVTKKKGNTEKEKLIIRTISAQQIFISVSGDIA